MEDGAKVVSERSSRFLGYVEDYDLTTAVKYAVRALELVPMIGELLLAIFFFQSASFSHSDRLVLKGISVGLTAPFRSRQANVCLRPRELSKFDLTFLTFLPQTSFTSLSFLSLALTFTSEETGGWLQPLPYDKFLSPYFMIFLSAVLEQQRDMRLSESQV